MRVIQVLPTFLYGDAIGNDTIALDKALKEFGYETMIYAGSLDPRLPRHLAKKIDEWEEPHAEDVILYHMAIAWPSVQLIRKAKCRKIAIYHNITPPYFYFGYSSASYAACADGLKQVEELRDAFDYCLADSEFNKQDLISYGYSCPIDVLPILIPFEDYQQALKASEKEKSKGANILFVGRVVPNKKFEDIIAAFALYQRYYDPDAKLDLIGKKSDKEPYYQQLTAYAAELGVRNVTFTGGVKFSEILRHFAEADVFLCMSEHEGFCVPLIEAMLFELPILAYDACAVKDTMGAGGILLKEKNMLEAAGLMDHLVRDTELRSRIIHNQKLRLEELRYENVAKQFHTYLKAFLEKQQ